MVFNLNFLFFCSRVIYFNEYLINGNGRGTKNKLNDNNYYNYNNNNKSYFINNQKIELYN